MLPKRDTRYSGNQVTADVMEGRLQAGFHERFQEGTPGRISEWDSPYGSPMASKKWENLWSAYCLHLLYYNLGRIHRTIRATPAMEAGIADHVWELKELLA